MSQTVAQALLEHFVKNFSKNLLPQPLLYEITSKRLDFFDSQFDFTDFIYNGLKSKVLATQKISLYILQKRIASVSQNSLWNRFFTLQQSLGQSNSSIVIPVLHELSNKWNAFHRGIGIKWWLSLWCFAFANEYPTLKMASINYFLKCPILLDELSACEQKDYQCFLLEVLLKQLNETYLFADIDATLLECPFGNTLKLFVETVINSTHWEGFVEQLLKTIKGFKCLPAMFYILAGIANSQPKARLLCDKRLIAFDLVGIMQNQAIYSALLKKYACDLLIETVFVHCDGPKVESMMVLNTLASFLKIATFKTDAVVQWINVHLEMPKLNSSADFEPVIEDALNGTINVCNIATIFKLLNVPKYSVEVPKKYLQHADVHFFHFFSAAHEYLQAIDEQSPLAQQMLHFYDKSLSIADLSAIIDAHYCCESLQQNTPQLILLKIYEKICNSKSEHEKNYAVVCYLKFALRHESVQAKHAEVFSLIKQISTLKFESANEIEEMLNKEYKKAFPKLKFMFISLLLTKFADVAKFSQQDLENMLEAFEVLVAADCVSFLEMLRILRLSDAFVFTAPLLHRLFSDTLAHLAHIESSCRLYFSILRGFLRVIFCASFMSQPDLQNALHEIIGSLLCKVTKKGVAIETGMSLMNNYFCHIPKSSMAHFAETFCDFLMLGVGADSTEEKTVASLSKQFRASTAEFSVEEDDGSEKEDMLLFGSAVSNAAELRAAYNSLLNSRQLDACPAFKARLLEVLLQRLASDEFAYADDCQDAFPNTMKHKKKTRLLTSLCVLLNSLQEVDAAVVHRLYAVLLREPIQSTRYFLETAFVLAVHRTPDPHAAIQILCGFLTDRNNERPYVLISVLTVILHAFNAGFVTQPAEIAALLNKIVCLFLNGNFMTRIYACFVFSRLVAAPNFCAKTHRFPLAERSVYDCISSYISHNDYCQKTIRKMSQICIFNDFVVAENFSMQFLFQKLPVMANLMVSEIIPLTFFELIAKSYNWHSPHAPLKVALNERLLEGWASLSFDEKPPIDAAADAHCDKSAQMLNSRLHDEAEYALQTKILPWSLAVDGEDAVQQPSKVDRKAKMRPAESIIFVASLLEKVPNIAGLCRTCEIFGVSTLVIPSANIKNDASFKTIAVTADMWIDLVEVKPGAALQNFLTKKRQEGYSLVGLEQTSTSTPLQRFCFAEKTVIVLGNEKHGMPVEIINLMDQCVEIPQFGIIRSLNAHVSGSILLWELRKQLSLSCA